MRQLLKRGLLAVIVVACSSVPGFAVEDDGSKIAITAPTQGEIVNETFPLKYELTKGTQAAHGHVYLDGVRQKGFEGTFRGVSKGRHQIMVKAATHDHKN
jgi:hypothetical protein